MTTQHTTEPWNQFREDENGKEAFKIVPAWGRNGMYFVATCYGPDAEANAEFIVRACNSHDALLAALEGLLANAPAPKGVRKDFSYILYLEAARAAIRAAKPPERSAP